MVYAIRKMKNKCFLYTCYYSENEAGINKTINSSFSLL